jgi:hypothetical protein
MSTEEIIKKATCRIMYRYTITTKSKKFTFSSEEQRLNDAYLEHCIENQSIPERIWDYVCETIPERNFI